MSVNEPNATIYRCSRPTIIVWEVILHRADGKLLLKPIDLVKEENDGRLDKPPRIADRVEEGERFLHAIDCLILEEQLIVLRDSYQEEDGSDVLEAMDPLLPLRPLATNVEHAVCQVANEEGCLCDTSRLHTRTEDILIVGHVVRSGDPINRVEVTIVK